MCQRMHIWRRLRGNSVLVARRSDVLHNSNLDFTVMNLSTLPTPALQVSADISTFDPDDLFVPQYKALQELKRRRQDLALKKLLDTNLDFVGQVFQNHFVRPRAVLFRQVATPSHEVLRFLRIARHMGLRPLIVEYHGDKFVSSGNAYKRALGKMPLYQQAGTDGRDIVQYRTIVDFNAYVGKPFSEVRCIDGTKLVDFHHKLLQRATRLNMGSSCVDATDWFRSSGGSAHEYYERFLSYFIRDAILFEVVLPTATEHQFAQEVIIPAFLKAQARYGLRPLIVELIPKNKAGRIFWDAYPKKVQTLL